jgi:hypothetical protein
MYIKLSIAKHFFSLLALIQRASPDGNCIVPTPPEIRTIPNGSCITTYTARPGSCDILGSWKEPDLALQAICLVRGCTVTAAERVNELRCTGTPCCSFRPARDVRSLCESKHESCTCEPGFEMVGEKCEMVCLQGWKRDQGVCEAVVWEGDHVSHESLL